MTTDDYVGLISSWHRAKPRFVQTVSATVDPFSQAQASAAAVPAAFDLDTAVGVQLDIDGQWIGRSRVVRWPYLDTYFRLDDPNRGLDTGVWRQPFDPDTILVTEDDEFYRRLLKAKVLINGWDGTVDGTQAALDSFFTDPDTHVFVDHAGEAVAAPNYLALDAPGRGLDESQWRISFFALDTPGGGLNESHWATPLDFPDVPQAVSPSMTVCVAGKLPSTHELAALGGGLLTTKPGGVTVEHRVTSVDGAPLFGLDIDNPMIAGLDVGAWGVDPNFLVALTV